MEINFDSPQTGRGKEEERGGEKEEEEEIGGGKEEEESGGEIIRTPRNWGQIWMP